MYKRQKHPPAVLAALLSSNSHREIDASTMLDDDDDEDDDSVSVVSFMLVDRSDKAAGVSTTAPNEAGNDDLCRNDMLLFFRLGLFWECQPPKRP